MSLRSWRGLFPHEVTVAAYAGQDRFGAPSYSTSPTTYQARVVGKRRLVHNAAGQQVVSDQTVYLYTPDAVGTQDKVTLTTAQTGSTETLALYPPILSVGRFPDQFGFHHTVLYL